MSLMRIPWYQYLFEDHPQMMGYDFKWEWLMTQRVSLNEIEIDKEK